jgi:cell division protein FtsI/penicillin-binding protein 2
MIPNRFVMSVNGVATSIKPAVKISGDSLYAQHMSAFMKKQSAPKKGKLGILVAGKTGTPERIFRGEQINDGWYVFFAPKATGQGHVVVCIRIEAAKGSSDAVRLAGRHIIPLLLERNYIRGFDPAEEKPVPLAGNKLLGSL